MKTPPPFRSLLLCILLGSGIPAIAGTLPAPADQPRELAIVVVEAVTRNPASHGIFNRISRVFTDVFEQRKWPVKITSERFAAAMPAHQTELRVFFQRIAEEMPSELVFRAWMILDDHGTKHDLGIVKFIYYPRSTEPMEDRLDGAVRGAAVIAADKIEPLLFPPAAPAKP